MMQRSFGEQAPWFRAPALGGNPQFVFDSIAGRPILLFLCGSVAPPACAEALDTVRRGRAVFDDVNACFFGVSIDPADVADGRIAQELPGLRWFVDADQAVSRLYGAVSDNPAGGVRYHPCFLLLDHRLRIVSRFTLAEAGAAVAATAALAAAGCETETAPVLIVPRVFEPALCRRLIELYEASGGTDSGFMRERDGMTVAVIDHSFKRRADHLIDDPALQAELRVRLATRLIPEIERAYQFRATHIERWLVACYDGASGGFFNPHRDNTTRGTAHRRFACTINLNAEEFTGGELRFPEYGRRQYRAPTGGAVIFSCSILHEAMPVTAGRRYAFLPFLHDGAAQAERDHNRQYIAAAATA